MHERRIPPLEPAPRVLLVEGQDDKHVVLNLCEVHEFTPKFQIRDKGSLEKVLNGIGPELNAKELMCLGIMMDANDSLESHWKKVRNRLTSKLDGQSVELDLEPKSLGTVLEVSIQGRMIRIGIWLMPDNRSSGELEDFVATMIPCQDPIWPLSHEYIDNIPSRDRDFKSKKVLRAKVYAWLATREEPGFMGAAIKKKDLDVGGKLTKDFMEWLGRLFQGPFPENCI